MFDEELVSFDEYDAPQRDNSGHRYRNKGKIPAIKCSPHGKVQLIKTKVSANNAEDGGT